MNFNFLIGFTTALINTQKTLHHYPYRLPISCTSDAVTEWVFAWLWTVPFADVRQDRSHQGYRPRSSLGMHLHPSWLLKRHMSITLPRSHSLWRFDGKATAWACEVSWGHTAPEQNLSDAWRIRKFCERMPKRSCMNLFEWRWDYHFSVDQIPLCSGNILSGFSIIPDNKKLTATCQSLRKLVLQLH